MFNCKEIDKRPNNESYNILVLEDSTFINDSIKKTLQRFHLECEQAFTVAQAVENVKLKEYDFILLDLNLPDGLGLDLLKETKLITNSISDPVVI